MRSIGIAALSAASVYGQSSLAGPNSGFLFDGPTRTIRMMQGTLGATTLSEPVLERVESAYVSPAGNRAIACRRGDCFAVVDLTSQELVTLPLSSTPEGVAWAPDGSAAILYSRSAGWIQPLNSLATEPELGQVWKVPGPGPLLAVAYGGSRTFVSIGGDAGGVFEITAASGLLRLADLQSAVALELKSNTLYALDGAAPAVLRVPVQGGPIDRWDVPLTDPVALRFGSNSALYVGGGSDHAILALDPSTGEVKERTELSFAPSVLAPLPGGSFLLTDRVTPDSLVWSFAPGRGAYFIPAPPIAEDSPARGRRR